MSSKSSTAVGSVNSPRSRPFSVGRRQLAGVALGTLTIFPAVLLVPSASQAQRREVLYQQFSSCPKFLGYVRSLALPQVTAFGLTDGVVSASAPRPSVIKSPTAKTPVILTPTTAAPARASATAPAPAAAPASGDSLAAKSATAVPATPANAAEQANSSTTNTQEQNVDEGDLIENDGRYLYTAANGSVRIVDTTDGKLIGVIPGQPGGEAQLILDGPMLAIVRQLNAQWPETVVERWVVSDPSRPKLFSTVHLEGTLVAARSVNHKARIVLQTPFGSRLSFVNPTGPTDREYARALRANRAVVNRATADDWLPRAYDTDQNGTASPLRQAVNCVEIGKPADTAGLGLTWATTLDLNVPNPRGTTSGSGGVVGRGTIVYSSDYTLFVATTAPTLPTDLPVPVATTKPGFGSGVSRPTITIPRSRTRTLIHAFDLQVPDGVTYLASGQVDGFLLNQFAMSEYGGALRVAVTTDGAGFGSPQQSGVRVFARNGRDIEQIGRLDGLGINEKIYGVRFLGDLGYIVTFRQTDPLYVIDLRDPRTPRRAGELKIPGYSAYLHPIGGGQLLGVGQDATDQGRRLGTMLQVFDVSDPANPKQLSKLRVGGQSEAEYDHRAFLWWGPTRDAVIPQTTYDSGRSFTGAVVAQVNADLITLQGKIQHEVPGTGPIGIVPVPAPAVGTAASPVFVPTTIPGQAILPPSFPYDRSEPIRRSAIVNGRLVTVSQNAVKVSDLSTISPLLYASFFDQP